MKTPGQVRRERWITREQVRANPNTLFLFGDNVQRVGLKGQAREMRGEPNAIGIATKWRPAMDPGAFFSDADFDQIRTLLDDVFKLLHIARDSGMDIVIPQDGLGTGLAQLATRAPRVHAYLQASLAELEG